jgi:O-antigen/teichoic acid export membrane protein
MRPIRELVRHTAIYGLGSVGASLISFVLIPVYTRYLGPEEYGVLALLLLAHAVLSRVYDLGLTNAVGRFYFDYQGPTAARALGEMVSTTLIFLAAYGGLATAVVWASAPSLASVLAGDPRLAGLVRIVGVSLLFEALAVPALTLIRMEERSTLWVAVSVMRVSGALLLNVYLVAFARLGVAGVLVSQALVNTLVFVVTAVPLARCTPLAFRPHVLRKMLAFGLPFLPVLLGILVIDLSDRYFLQRLRSTAEVGVYALGSKFGQVTMIAVGAFSLGWAPLRYRIFERADAKEVYVRILNLFASAAALGVVLMSVFGDEIVRLTTTPPFFAGARVIPFVCASYALYGVHLLVATGMGVTKRTLGLTTAVAAAAGLNVAGNLLLIPPYGMMGAAVATVIAYVALVFWTDRASRRVYPIEYEWGRVFAIAAAAAGVIVADRLLQPDEVLSGSLLGAVLLLTFVGLLTWAGGVRTADVRAVRSWVGELRGERRSG